MAHMAHARTQHLSGLKRLDVLQRTERIHKTQSTGLWIIATLMALALLAWGALRMAEERTVITPNSAASAEDPALGTGLNDTSTNSMGR